jgi:hypothetical protein
VLATYLILGGVMLETKEVEAIVSDLVFVNIYCNSNPDYEAVLKGLKALNLSYEQTYDILNRIREGGY